MEGMEAARRRGVDVGWPYKFTDKEIRTAHEEIAQGKASLSKRAKQMNCAPSTLSESFKRLGLNT